MPLTAGTRLGPYEVLAPLGAGGMGEVYRAHDSKLGRDVALKILPDAFAQDPERLARFKREAHVLAALNHPNIAAIYGLEDAGPVHALVLELVEGPTLAEVIAPSLSDSLHIARQIVDALEAAHAQGIVHRDLKPANVKVRPDGTVKVLDFGLAKALGSESAGPASGDLANSPTMTSPFGVAQGGPAMTALGMILGTAAYMSPEQAKGRVIDKRADIWAFGCVLYEMVTGRRAFEGDDVSDTLASILKSDPDWSALPAGTPAALRRLLRRCLSKDLAGRLSDIGVARLEIAEALAPSDTEGDRSAAAILAPVAPPPRSRWPVIALVLAIAALIGVSPFLVSHLREAPPSASTIRFTLAAPPGARFPPGTAGARATVSPNGQVVVFRAQRPGATARLWVRAIDTLEAKELVGTDGGNRSFWSADSRSIAFAAEGKLKKIDASGGPVQTICDCATFAGGAWHANGTIIASCGGPIVRVPDTGGQPVPLTTLDPVRKETLHGTPQFLPDGRFIFTAQPGNVVFLGSLDSSDRAQLIAGESDTKYAAPGYLLFVRQETLMVQEFDPARATLVGAAVPLAENVLSAAGVSHVSASENGVLTYEPVPGQTGGTPVWVDRRGAEVGPIAPGVKAVLFPRLSPDGRRLAAISDRDLWVYDLQGRPEIRLTFDGSQKEHFSPLWSLDSQRIVFEATSPSPLYSVAADGSNATVSAVSPVGHFHPHGWLPDSRDLLAVQLGGLSTDIVAFPLGEKSEPRALIATPAREGFEGASFSPDGRWLAYASDPTGRQEIWVRPYPGPGAPERVSPNGGAEPIWARSGRELFYLEGNKVMAVAVQAGAPRPFGAPVLLFESAYLHGISFLQPPTYDVAPDGRFLMLKLPAGADVNLPPFTVVVNWVDELKRRTQR